MPQTGYVGPRGGPLRPLLVSIPFSPWSRRAKLALQRAGVAFDLRTYTPTLSEPWLRWKLGRAVGQVTVPVLFTAEGPLTDSFDIARYAARSNPALLPDSQLDAVRTWNERADAALWAGRVITTRAVRADPSALQASLPPPIRALGPLGRAIGNDATRRLLAKYPDPRDDAALTQALADYADALADALGGREHLLDGPTYADITAAFGLAFIAPDPSAKLAPEAVPCWTRPDIVRRHAALFAWRDRVLNAGVS